MATARWQLGIAPELPASGVFGASLHLRKERAGRFRVFEGLDRPLERSYGMLVHLRVRDDQATPNQQSERIHRRITQQRL
jgi:hypothetical protein